MYFFGLYLSVFLFFLIYLYNLLLNIYFFNMKYFIISFYLILVIVIDQKKF